jgi:hypothetical protein
MSNTWRLSKESAALSAREAATLPALLHLVHLHLIRAVYHLQGVAGMSLLTAAFLAALLSKALGLLEAVAGWGFAAVSAVLVQLVFEVFDPRFQDGDL